MMGSKNARALTRNAGVVVVVVVGMLASGCDQSVPSEEERAAIETVTREYLNDLADAYSNNDVSMLSRHATLREIAEVEKLLDKLQETGDRLQATLLHADIESVVLFRVINATVKLTEVWDVGRYDPYTGREKGRNPRSIQSSIIQLRRLDGEWKVIGRRVMETQQGSAWTVATPVAAAGAEPPEELPEGTSAGGDQVPLAAEGGE